MFSLDASSLVARPISAYADLWGKDCKTLNQWCQKGWVPGAYKHPCGEWWVKPLDLIGLAFRVSSPPRPPAKHPPSPSAHPRPSAL